MASQNVKVTFTMRGEDRASAAINKAGRSADQTSGKMRALGKAALAVGAGMASIGAAVAAVKRMAEMTAEVERLRASMNSVFGPDGLQVAIDTAREIGGVGAESVAKLARTLEAAGIQGGLTIGQMQKITRLATRMGITGDEALTRFADAIAKGNTRSLQGIGIYINAGRVMDEYAKAAGITTTQITQAEKAQVVFNAALNAAASSTGAATEAYSKNDNALARLDNAWIELKASMSSALSGPLSGIVDKTAKAIELAARWGKVLLKVAEVINKPFQIALDLIFSGIAASSVALSEAMQGNFKAADHVLATFKRSAIASFDEMRESVRQLGKEIDSAMVRRPSKAAASIGGFMGPAMPADIRAREARRRAGGGKRGRRGDGGMRKFLRGGSELDDAKVFAQMAQDEIKAEQDRVNAIGAAMRAEMDLEAKRDMFKQAMADRDKQRNKDRIQSNMDVASSVGASVASIMATFGAQEAAMRLQAGVEAAIAFGKGLVAMGEQKYPQAAMLFAGSAALAAQAIAPPSMSAPGGAAPSTGPQTVGAGGGGFGGGRVVNVNFGNGVVLGNPHDVARTIKGALAASAGTGF